MGGWQLSNTTNWSSGLPWTPSFNECGAEQDARCLPSEQRLGHTSTTGAGSLDPITHTITYFTPVANIVTNPGLFTDPGAGEPRATSAATPTTARRVSTPICQW